MSHDFEIKKIKKLKFTENDIYIFVEWFDSYYTYKPNVASLGVVKRKKRNEWKVRWEPSWIKLTTLTATSALWANFYKNKVLPFMQNMYDTTHNVVIR